MPPIKTNQGTEILKEWLSLAVKRIIRKGRVLANMSEGFQNLLKLIFI